MLNSTPDLATALKAKLDSAESECSGLAQTMNRLQQNLNEVTTQLVRAQGRYEGYKESLALITPPADATASGETHAPVPVAPVS